MALITQTFEGVLSLNDGVSRVVEILQVVRKTGEEWLDFDDYD
jgi:hypothetical protein